VSTERRGLKVRLPLVAFESEKRMMNDSDSELTKLSQLKMKIWSAALDPEKARI
jgi:hypothetical protein